jgi:chromatin segregation and condensation protein Rec8/ScpA/Scc1 (kleisin family)
MFLPVEAKEWSIDDRQQALMQQINEGQKAKELTVKEAKSLRKDLANLAKKKAKMKAKADKDNTLTKENQTELEGDLNKISVEIQKLKLEKRIQK